MLHNYLKVALRNLRKRPVYSFLNTVGLTLGLTTGLLIALFVYFHFSTDRHHPGRDRLYRVVLDLHLDGGLIERSAGVSLPMVEALRTSFPALEKVAFLKELIEPTVSASFPPGEGSSRGFVESRVVACVNPDYFQTFRYDWLSGNSRTALTEPNTVVLTLSYARKYFGTEKALGKTLFLNGGLPLKVVGILANPTAPTDLRHRVFISWSSIQSIDPGYELTNFTWMSSRNQIFVRLTDQTPVEKIEQRLPLFSKKYFGLLASAFQFHLQPLRDVHVDIRYGGTISRGMLHFLVLVSLALVGIACVNFINLATARFTERTREVGVRKVLGSTRGQLFGQFMLETNCLVLSAGLLAVLLAIPMVPYLNGWLAINLHRSLFLSPAFWIVWGALLALVALAAGAYPALVLSAYRPVVALRAVGARSRFSPLTLRRVLIVSQFVIAQVLTISTVIVNRQLQFMQSAELGFDQSTVLTVVLPESNEAQRRTVRNRLLQIPQVRNVTFQYRPPAADSYLGGSVRYNNRPDWEQFPIRDKWADSHYLPTYQLQLIAGRNLVERDSVREFVVNEAFVKKLGVRNPQEVLNKPIVDGSGGSDRQGVIVGVMRDFHSYSLREFIEPTALVYHPEGFQQAGIKLQTKEVGQTLERIGRVWRQSFPQAVFSYTFLDEQIRRFYEKERVLQRLVFLFSGVAIGIACLGLFGLTVFAARQRTKEIGIRKVLGASVGGIVALLSRDFLKLVLIAILIASPIAWWAMDRWLQDFAYKIRIDGWTFVLTALFAVGLAFLTIGYQSVKAALMNPVKSLTSE